MSFFKKEAIFYILAFFILSAFYTLVAFSSGVNSDSASVLVEAKDMADGNWLLKDWTLSTVSFYFTDAIWYAILIKLIGYTKFYVYIIPSVLYAITTLSCVKLATEGKNGALGGLLAGAFFIVPGNYMGDIITSAVFHGSTLCFCILMLICFDRMIKGFKAYGIIYLSVSPFLFFSDKISIFWLLIPITIASLHHATIKKETGRITPFVLIIASYILYKALAIVFNNIDSFNVPGVQSNFVRYEDLSENIYWFLLGMFNIFNAKFFGHPLASKDAMFLIIQLAGCAALIYAFYQILIRNFKRLPPLDMAMALSCIIIVVSFLLSTLPVSEGSGRYLLPVVFLAAIFVSRNIEIKKHAHMLLVVAFSVLLLATNQTSTSGHPKEDSPVKVSQFLKRHDLKSGYADFWNSASVTANGGVIVRQVTIDNKVKPRGWISKSSWYDDYADFIYMDKKTASQKESNLIKQFGEYDRKIVDGNKVVFVWNKNISDYL